MKPLPPFNPQAVCPKCGSENVSRTWREASKTEQLPEHLERICLECSVQWQEACLDQAPANGKKATVQTSAKKPAKKQAAGVKA
jgi:hypothetical protein